MNSELARQTIGETFSQKFDDARFLYFIRNLVNHLDESKRQTWTLKKAAFEDYVNHFTRLGTYTDPGGEKVDVQSRTSSTRQSLKKRQSYSKNYAPEKRSKLEA